MYISRMVDLPDRLSPVKTLTSFFSLNSSSQLTYSILCRSIAFIPPSVLIVYHIFAPKCENFFIYYKMFSVSRIPEATGKALSTSDEIENFVE